MGGKLLGGGLAFGDSDVVNLVELPDDGSAAAVALAVGTGGGVKSSKTTKLFSGSQWVDALKKASGVAGQYKPAR